MDELTIIAKAVRRARLLLRDYIEPGERNAEITIAKLVGVLEHRDVSDAIDRLHLAPEGPGLRSRLASATSPLRRAAIKQGRVDIR
jgi:hypothetical protein